MHAVDCAVVGVYTRRTEKKHTGIEREKENVSVLRLSKWMWILLFVCKYYVCRLSNMSYRIAYVISRHRTYATTIVIVTPPSSSLGPAHQIRLTIVLFSMYLRKHYIYTIHKCIINKEYWCGMFFYHLHAGKEWVATGNGLRGGKSAKSHGVENFQNHLYTQSALQFHPFAFSIPVSHVDFSTSIHVCFFSSLISFWTYSRTHKVQGNSNATNEKEERKNFIVFHLFAFKLVTRLDTIKKTLKNCIERQCVDERAFFLLLLFFAFRFLRLPQLTHSLGVSWIYSSYDWRDIHTQRASAHTMKVFFLFITYFIARHTAKRKNYKWNTNTHTMTKGEKENETTTKKRHFYFLNCICSVCVCAAQ